MKRLQVGGGEPQLVARGEQPAISPDGRFLAYATGPRDQTVAVRDLQSGRTRTWDLGPTMGPDAHLLSGGLTWAGSRLVLMPQADAIATVGSSGSPGRHVGATGFCGSRAADTTCLIVFDPSAARPVLRTIHLPGVSAQRLFSAGRVAPDAVLVGTYVRGGERIDRIDVTASDPHRVEVVEGPFLAEAVSPSGTKLLYILGHSPPALWVANLHQGHLAHARRLLVAPRIGAIAW